MINLKVILKIKAALLSEENLCATAGQASLLWPRDSHCRLLWVGVAGPTILFSAAHGRTTVLFLVLEPHGDEVHVTETFTVPKAAAGRHDTSFLGFPSAHPGRVRNRREQRALLLPFGDVASERQCVALAATHGGCT